MDIKELMVGDIVEYLDDDQPIPVVVVKIDGPSSIVCLKQKNGHTFNTAIDFLKPIPLTPEILEKNGFIKYTDFYMWKEESLEPIHLDNYDEDGWRLRINCDNIPCECKYVHELQNILRLFKINKQISLP